MRCYPSLFAGVPAILSLASSGCDQKQVEQAVQVIGREIVDEMGRDMFLREHGPMILTSVIGAFASNGGPAALNGLCANEGWRLLIIRDLPELRRIPSPLDVPDPNRPVKIGQDEE